MDSKDIEDYDADESVEMTPKDITVISAASSDDGGDAPKFTGPGAARGRRMAALGVGVVAATAIGIGVYFFMDNNNVATSTSAIQNANYQGTVNPADLVDHSTPDDCWLLIGDTVHDLTDYAPDHPGGENLITDLCGTNATLEYKLEHPLSLLQTLPESVIGTIQEGTIPEGDNEESGDDFVYVPPTKTDPPVDETTTAAPVDAASVAPVDASTTAPAAASPSTGAPVAASPSAASPAASPTSAGGSAPVAAPVAETAFISEIHYDNDGTDSQQFVEIAFSNTLDVSGYTIEFVRGSNGVVYGQESLQAFTIGDTDNGLTFAYRMVESFLNGPDGVVLVDGNGNVVEFISYGGQISASDGSAAGMSSTDIGMVESGFASVGLTLQKTGTGCVGDDFNWGVIADETAGSVNSGMTVTCYADGANVPAPAPWSQTIAPTPGCYADFYSMNTIANHYTTDDCWEAIYGIVYDFSSWARQHDGGYVTLGKELSYCEPSLILPH